jgi:GntR family transcriptional regulator
VSAGLFRAEDFADEGTGPLYLRLTRTIGDAIDSGRLKAGESLPPERELAALTGLSRVTVRKAVQTLVQAGRLVQRRGSGTFVAPRVEKVEQALSLLTSFSEDMARRGKAVRSVWLSRAVHAPSPEEVMALGLAAHDRVARLERVRMADEVPLAIERASLSTAILPDPEAVGASLYAVLAERCLRPVRAVQRISAASLGAADAGLLEVPEGAATLRIERISYLPSGRVVEFTRSLYRGDAYDFAAEMRIPADQEGRTE